MEEKKNPMQEKKEELAKLAHRIYRENPLSLHLTRVPRKTKKKFISIANDEFEGDYGMLLKWLIDGILDVDSQEMIARMEQMSHRIDALESKFLEFLSGGEKPQKREINMVSGKTMEMKRRNRDGK